MGFEVCYSFHDRINGEYNKEEVKTFKKKVGDPFDEISLEKLASSIISQLARRDIWIIALDVYELSKKKVAFKETKGGIVIKNKKFLFDTIEGDMVVEIESEEEAPQKSLPIKTAPVADASQPSATLTRKVLEVVIFSPEPQQLEQAKRKGLKLTPDKKYSVYKKTASNIGEIYTVVDDENKDVQVADSNFIPGQINLYGDRELGFSNKSKYKSNLLWEGSSIESGMPNLRKR